MAAAIRRVLQREISGPEGQAILDAIQQGNPKQEGNPRPRDPTKEVKAAGHGRSERRLQPTHAPFSTVPPSLLLKLPPLPEQVRYRFVGRTLILRDTEANVILDYIENAVPDPSQAKPVDPCRRRGPVDGGGNGGGPPISQRRDRSEKLRLPMKEGSVRFAAMGDTGTGSKAQYEMGRQMAAFHEQFPFEFMIMLGDDLYGGSRPNDFLPKFELPYEELLDGEGEVLRGARQPRQSRPRRTTRTGTWAGKRYYTFRVVQGKGTPNAGTGVRFFALDSNYMDKVQLDWLEKELQDSASEWKIAFFHHPLYSSARAHGSSLDLRALLEPLFVKYGVSVVVRRARPRLRADQAPAGRSPTSSPVPAARCARGTSYPGRASRRSGSIRTTLS